MFSKCCGGKLAGPGKPSTSGRRVAGGVPACTGARRLHAGRTACRFEATTTAFSPAHCRLFQPWSLQIAAAVQAWGRLLEERASLAAFVFSVFPTCVNLILHTSTFEEIVAAGSTSRNFPGKAEEKEKEQQRRGRESSKWFKKTRHIAAGPGVA